MKLNLRSLFRAAIDPRNTRIAADVGGHVAEIVKDGRITPQEVIHAVHDTVRDGLIEYGAANRVAIPEGADSTVIATAVAEMTGNFGRMLASRMKGGLTYAETNDLIGTVALDMIGVCDGIAERAKGESA